MGRARAISPSPNPHAPEVQVATTVRPSAPAQGRSVRSRRGHSDSGPEEEDNGQTHPEQNGNVRRSKRSKTSHAK